MDSNPKYVTARRHSLVKTYRIVMNHIFMMNKIIKKQKSPFFRASTEFTEFTEWRHEKCGLSFFLKKYKIENNGFITILGSVGTKGMIPTTNFC